MNENTRTMVFVAVAAVVVIGVWITRPALVESDRVEAQGTLLFPDFKNPLEATSLDIVKYDEATGDVVPFDVAQVNGVWSIPSHDNYPADAQKHLAEAAASLMGLKVLSVVSDNTGDHGLYGVIDPTDKDLKAGTSGVGMQVTLKDKSGKKLVALVIGKEDPEEPGLRYVRRVGQEAVYSVAVNTDTLTTKFSDWIEKDLLKLNTFDIHRIFIQDYSVDEARGSLIQRGELTLGYDDTGNPRWKMLVDRVFGAGEKWQAVPMAPDEELNTAKLNTLTAALDDLKIVDVARKPAGLSADLVAEKSLINSDKAKAALMQRGFIVATTPGGKPAIYSNEGEIRCLMKDGVEYVLRFGNIAESSKGTATKADKEKKSEVAEDKDASGVNRYIFVMAEFNPAPITKPDLQPLPTTEPKKPEAKASPADHKKPAAADTKKGDAEKKTPSADDAKKAEKKKPADSAKTAEDAKRAEAVLKAQRERIEKENKRKQDEYDAKLAEGKKKVSELNRRFADWYYVISESVYKQIHLGRKEVVKKKEKDAKPGAASPAPGNTPDAFNRMIEQGLPKQ